MCRESWLKDSATGEQFAEAMMKCQHPFGLCGQDQYCHYEGKCFKKDVKTKIQALTERVEALEKQLAITNI
ncbi:hypothetical protein [Acinetobacter sp. Ac_5812]|uniref:hypothetical protein n=1 Tax=Acinetobacter sp. Ac_5812 TaxID=1848937 RepID=UPI00148FA380|nr:hypothetical protein [Acinetobacter sp. Ac_5812]NNP70945.1 hypothetical protein [Acinetobacter sp. Ac_5812]